MNRAAMIEQPRLVLRACWQVYDKVTASAYTNSKSPFIERILEHAIAHR
jgi:hypothetical protein